MAITHPAGRTRVHHPFLDRTALGAAVLGLLMVAVGMTVLAVVGFAADDADFDNWKGAVVVVGLFGGVLVSLAASAIAIVAKLLDEHWAWLWFPLVFGPAFALALPFWFE